MVILFEFSAWNAYGRRYLKDKELIPFLKKNLNKYFLNSYSPDQSILMTYPNDLPPICKTLLLTPISKWYFGDDFGMVPRWTKASKIIDAYRAELIAKTDKPVKKTLESL